ncbi:helix-turn-helix domain-containing protein [Rhizobium mesoamericanum]|uniref:Putative excisionase n=1 Tax=Rhizobium mesoamericanum STM3625 TaxID=1211777 RepID=K0PW96_9HYPH|nr:helix-turn-helix domain-containing protein [Rhizobium mesoamericanum]CCM78033.1 putative excisionase [Rhizobium mesoamericanum STM3625]
MDNYKTIVSISEIAHEYGVSRTTIYAEIKAKRLTAKKLGNRTLIRRTDAEAWYAALPDLDTSREAA